MKDEFPKELRFKLSDPLNYNDTEESTFGCRAFNPDICKNCMTVGLCAFVNDDHICRAPSKKWKKYYLQLKGE